MTRYHSLPVAGNANCFDGPCAASVTSRTNNGFDNVKKFILIVVKLFCLSRMRADTQARLRAVGGINC